MVSFGAIEDELLDDSRSLAASDAEDILGSSIDPDPLPSMDPSDAKTGMELFRVLSRAVEELGLEWSTAEEPTRSRLDEWFLLGCRQAPRQRAMPFFQRSMTSSRNRGVLPTQPTLHKSASSALSSVDSAEEKVYEKLPPLPAHCHWMESKGRSPLQTVQDNVCPPWTSLLLCRQAASALHSMAVLQVFQAKLLQAMNETGPDPAAFRELRSATDLRATKATAQAIGRSMASCWSTTCG